MQGVSDASFGSMAGSKSHHRAVKFLKYLGNKVGAREFVWAEQVFGAKVHICKIEDSGKTIKGVDGLISNVRNQVMAVVSADCVPILLYDPKKEVVAALHGSRKSLLKGIIKNAVRKMVLSFGSKPQDILVGMGPHIRKCHYWLKKEAYQNLKKTGFKKYFISKSGKTYFDLTKLAFDELLKTGIKGKNIEDRQICTFCQHKKYFSARKEQENPKIYPEKNSRFAGFIGLKTPQILRLSGRKLDGSIKKATACVKRGEVLVCPTDTVYGLVTDATNERAVERLFKIKKRNLRKHIPIFIKDFKMAKKFSYINREQEEFLKKVWPGKVTVVLKRKKSKIKIYGAGEDTIALRIPDYRFLNILLKKINRSLTGTSANISGKPPSTKVKEVLKQFENDKIQPDLILDAGNLLKSLPSTIISLVGDKPKILRRGAVKFKKLYGRKP